MIAKKSRNISALKQKLALVGALKALSLAVFSREIFRLDRENFTFEAKILSRIQSIIIVNISGLLRSSCRYLASFACCKFCIIIGNYRSPWKVFSLLPFNSMPRSQRLRTRENSPTIDLLHRISSFFSLGLYFGPGHC